MSENDKLLIDDLTARVIKARSLVAMWRAEADPKASRLLHPDACEALNQAADELAAAVGEPYTGEAGDGGG